MKIPDPLLRAVCAAPDDDGVRQVRAGATSLEEVMRVVDLTDRMA